MKCIGEIPNVNGAIEKVKEYEHIELGISIKKRKLVNHLKKWSTLSSL